MTTHCRASCREATAVSVSAPKPLAWLGTDLTPWGGGGERGVGGWWGEGRGTLEEDTFVFLRLLRQDPPTSPSPPPSLSLSLSVRCPYSPSCIYSDNIHPGSLSLSLWKGGKGVRIRGHLHLLAFTPARFTQPLSLSLSLGVGGGGVHIREGHLHLLAFTPARSSSPPPPPPPPPSLSLSLSLAGGRGGGGPHSRTHTFLRLLRQDSPRLSLSLAGVGEGGGGGGPHSRRTPSPSCVYSGKIHPDSLSLSGRWEEGGEGGPHSRGTPSPSCIYSSKIHTAPLPPLSPSLSSWQRKEHF